MEADLVRRAGIAYEGIPAAGVHGIGWGRLPGNAIRLAQGYGAARSLVERYRPNVTFFTGGYVGVPMALAARHVPSVVLVPDIEPGLALRWISRLARRICVTTDESVRFYDRRERVTVTGYPTRSEFRGLTRDEGRRVLGLAPDRPVVLVMGGSRGARSINRALWRILPGLLGRAQVMHLTGELDWPQVESVLPGLPEARRRDYHAYAYLHAEMGSALAAADVVVSRAGASALGEYPAFGLASILVPYPHAWRYQKVNADYLERHGAAIVLKDERLNEHLWTALVGLLDSPDRQTAMARAAAALARPEAAGTIAGQIVDLGTARGDSA